MGVYGVNGSKFTVRQFLLLVVWDYMNDNFLTNSLARRAPNLFLLHSTRSFLYICNMVLLAILNCNMLFIYIYK